MRIFVIMRNQTLLQNRNQLIYERYSSLWADGLREEIIWPRLCAEFYLSEKTIYKIILSITKEKKSAV